MRRSLPCALVVVFAVVATLPSAAAADAAPQPETRLLVAVADANVVDDVAAHAERIGADVESQIPAGAALSVTATPTEAARLAADDDVVGITPDIKLKPALAQSGPLVQADTMSAHGYDGSGRAIAIIDTGVQSDHEFFGGRVVDGACFSSGSSCPNTQTTQSGVAGGEPCTFSTDCFHGTHVAGIAAGENDDFAGVAPDASILSIAVYSESEDDCDGEPCLDIWTSDIMDALQQVYDWHDDYDIAAVNMSLGSSISYSGANCDSWYGSSFLKPLIDDLKSVGIPTVVAAGNSAATSRIGFPACISSAISVGATTKSDAVASYSDSAAALDVWAPGSAITSSAPTAIFGSGYATASGTSMAAPHVAGAFAAVDELVPSWTLTQRIYRVTKTGPIIVDARNGLERHRLRLSSDLTPPQTAISTKPATFVEHRKVTFRFRGGSSFECKFDKGSYRPCVSPKSVSVRKGLHKFFVRARDGSGNQDATSVMAVWKYV